MSAPSLADDKWVRIMCDFCADGVWSRDGASDDADELPVSQALRDRIRAWQRWHDSREDGPYPQSHPDWRPFPVAEFAAEGLAIARAVKAELPDWTVVYFDEARSGNRPRLDYEYEVTGGGEAAP